MGVGTDTPVPDQARPHDDSTNRSHRVAARTGPAFTQPTFARFTTLALAAVLTTGRRTAANLLRTAGTSAPGHRTSYQRVLSASWSGLHLACLLARFAVRRLLPAGVVTIVGDETVDGHRRKKVYGKARHRDPVRSSHSYTPRRYGHRAVGFLLSGQAQFPCPPRDQFTTPSAGYLATLSW
jgi:hypothetical protein